MIRALSVWYLFGTLLVGLNAFAQAAQAPANAPFPAYRHAEMETRLQAEGELPREPSPARELAALDRATTAVRARDAAGLAAAARDFVIHAGGAAAGWNKAATAWAGLSRSWRTYGGHRDDRRDRREAALMAQKALRESAYSLYAAYRSTSDRSEAGRILIAFGTVQDTLEEYVDAELALSAALAVKEDGGVRDRLLRIRGEYGFKIVDIRHDRDRGGPPRLPGTDCRGGEEAPARHRGLCRPQAQPRGPSDGTAGRHRMHRQSRAWRGVHARRPRGSAGHRRQDRRPGGARCAGAGPSGPGPFPVGTLRAPGSGTHGLSPDYRERERGRTEPSAHHPRQPGGRGHARTYRQEPSPLRLKGIAEDLVEHLWQGTLPIENTRNREVVTAVSIGLPDTRTQTRVYVLAATVTELRIHSYSGAVQWFVVSDIRLLALRGADGLSVFARSLSSAEPLAGVTLFLQARNEDTLASLTTDVHGRQAGDGAASSSRTRAVRWTVSPGR